MQLVHFKMFIIMMLTKIFSLENIVESGDRPLYHFQ